MMDQVRKTFDKWAQNGRAELMELEHGKNVSKFLESIWTFSVLLKANSSSLGLLYLISISALSNCSIILGTVRVSNFLGFSSFDMGANHFFFALELY